MEIIAENIKCGGCINSITKAILEIPGTANVEVNVESEVIKLDADEELRPIIVEKLAHLGYPEVGNNNLFAKAKSYVSCAIGKITS